MKLFITTIIIATLFLLFLVTGPGIYDYFIIQPKMFHHYSYQQYYSEDDLDFGRKEVFPKASTPEKTMEVYFNALQEREIEKLCGYYLQ
jgi:hypothetical protein